MKKLLSILIGIYGGALATSEVHAQAQIQVHVQTAGTPKSVLGLVVSKRTVLSQPVALEQLVTTAAGRGSLLVPVTVDASTPPDSVVSALVMNDDGTIAIGDVRPVIEASLGASYLQLPDCPAERAETGDVPGKLGLLDSLVKLRTDLRAKYVEELQRQLTPDLAARLIRLEELFGIQQHPPLAADLPPAVLADRLSRLMESVENYRAYAPQQSDQSKQ
jgi:hypothetical protein